MGKQPDTTGTPVLKMGARAPEWHVLNATEQPLGRLATRAAHLLLGKHRTDFAKNKVAPVYVVVTNSDALVVTGAKRKQKFYRRHTRHPGGLKERSLEDALAADSRWVIKEAVAGMLPKNSLRSQRLNQLKIYKQANHPHLPQVGPVKTEKT